MNSDSSTVDRALDLVIAGIGAILSAPVIAVLSVTIRRESNGSAIYRQQRVGKDGAPFQIYKLRTMVQGAEFTGAGLAIQEGDQRITEVGALLRRYSLDELPNLWNVLRGDMSVIGPRPTLQHQVDAYTERQRGRLAVKPGITGWAQVNGLRGQTSIADRVEWDNYYIENWSLRFDLRILVLTVAEVLRLRDVG